MIRADEMAVLDEGEGFAVIPYAILKRFLKTKDDEKIAKWLFEHNGTFFHIMALNEPVQVVKKYLIEKNVGHTSVHEVVEFRTKSSLKGERYLLNTELTSEEYICKKVKDAGLKGRDAVAKYQDFHDEWTENLA